MSQPLSRLEYTRVGSGEPLVLIHGLGHQRQAWNPVLDELASSFEVFAIDLAGFGESEPYGRDVPYTIDNACVDLAANFALWGIDRPHVAGNSLGGALSLELGARDLVRSVTALSPAGFFGGLPDRVVAVGNLLALKAASYLPDAVVQPIVNRTPLRRAMVRSLYEHGERLAPNDFLVDSHSLRDCKGFLPVLKHAAQYQFTRDVDVPTTVAWGTRDKLLLYSQSDRAREQLPQAHHVALPGCGHVPMLDDPELVVRVIEQTAAAADSGTDIAANS